MTFRDRIHKKLNRSITRPVYHSQETADVNRCGDSPTLRELEHQHRAKLDAEKRKYDHDKDE